MKVAKVKKKLKDIRRLLFARPGRVKWVVPKGPRPLPLDLLNGHMGFSEKPLTYDFLNRGHVATCWPTWLNMTRHIHDFVTRAFCVCVFFPHIESRRKQAERSAESKITSNSKPHPTIHQKKSKRPPGVFRMCAERSP